MNTPELAELVHQDAIDGIAQQVVGAVIEHDNRILLLQRPTDDFRGGTWELPSGKVEVTDTDLVAALQREVTEETGLTVAEIIGYLGAFDYTSGSGRHTRQHTWAVTVPDHDQVQLSEHDDFAWVATANQHPVSAEVRQLVAAHFSTSAS